MSSEVGSIQLRELCIRITKGTTPTKGEGFVERGINYIKSESITADGSIDASKFAFIDTETHSKLARSQLRAGNVLFSMAGVYLGKTAVVLSEHLPANTNQAVGIITLDESKAEPYFIHYSLQSPACRSWVLRSAAQSAQPNFNLQEIGDLQIPAFPLARQKEIAATLRTLDDRIALLRETNATLEAIAQALFKSWFVDFDPVRAKQQGRPPESLDPATAALFPDNFEDTELGPVPKGWRVDSFGDFIERKSVGKKYDQKSAFPEGIVPILDQGKSGIIGYHNDEPGVKASLEYPVVVFANHTCYMRLITHDFSAIQNVLPFVGKEVDTVWAFFATKDRIEFTEYKGHWPDFVIEKSAVPTKELTQAFRNTIDPLIKAMRNNELQAKTLATLRDTLLPRLISGKLHLTDLPMDEIA